jgi:integrase
VLVSISSTNTSRFGSISPASIILRAALCHSSRSSALTTLRFWLKPILFSNQPTVELLRLLPVRLSTKRRLCATVAAGRSSTFTSRSFPSAKYIQELLGHDNIAITLDTYSHVLPNMQGEAVAAMQEALS